MPLYCVQWKDYCNLSWPPTVNIVFTVITVLHPYIHQYVVHPTFDSLHCLLVCLCTLFSGKTTMILISWPPTLSSQSPLYLIQFVSQYVLHPTSDSIFCLLMCHYTWFCETTTETFSQPNTISSVISCNYSWFGTTKTRIFSQSPTNTSTKWKHTMIFTQPPSYLLPAQVPLHQIQYKHHYVFPTVYLSNTSTTQVFN